MIDRAEPLAAIPPRDADIVVISTPVEASIDIIRRVLDSGIDDSALVLDVGSVKGRVVESALSSSKPDIFVGCHPMAGSEKSGYEYSSASLYEGSVVFITPSSANPALKLNAAALFWESMGASCGKIDPYEHDKILAYTSHLPHFAASATASALSCFIRESGFSGDINKFIGNGFRDTTRVSAGSPSMWTEISSMNSENIEKSIDTLISILSDIKSFIRNESEAPGGLSEFLEGVKKFRTGIK